jgi:hypothetical protein
MPPTQKWALGIRIFDPTFTDYINILHTPNLLLKEIIFACHFNQKYQTK